MSRVVIFNQIFVSLKSFHNKIFSSGFNRLGNVFRYSKNSCYCRLFTKNDLKFQNLRSSNYNVLGHSHRIILLNLLLWKSVDTETAEMSSPVNDKTARTDAIKKADDLFAENKHEEVCDTLAKYKESEDVEVLWRIARSKYKLATQSNIKKDVKETAIKEGFDAISKALEADDKHYAVHKWMSVLLDARSELIGMKERITQLEKVKQHMLEAVKLNPNDATTYHMLGSWCYQIADMAWYQRKVAATLFASPPTSSFQEALQYFQKAEEVQPKFYSHNLVMLGKTHMKLGENEKAHHFLELASQYMLTSDDDVVAHKEALELLKKLNFKKI